MILINLFYILAEVQALNDVWIIGDIFLRHMFQTLQNMKADAIISKKAQPYLYDFFNVLAFFQPSSGAASGSMYKIHNALIEALNKKAHPSCYLLVVPDWDLILQANHFIFRIKIILEKQIPWFIKQIERAFTIRKEDLRSKCWGAVACDTRIVWIGMIECPLIKNHPFSHFNNTVNLRKKFNGLLQEN